MGTKNRTKGIKNRGSMIHEDKKKKLKEDWSYDYLEQYKIKEEHDDPRNGIPSDAV